MSLAALALSLTLTATAAEPSPIAVSVPARKEPVSYAKEIADLLDAKCVGCHGNAMAMNTLNLGDLAGMLKEGKRGPAIVPGKADESLLFRMAAHRVEPVMPPAEKKDRKPMTPEELGLLKLWIDAGARDDSESWRSISAPTALFWPPAAASPRGRARSRSGTWSGPRRCGA